MNTVSKISGFLIHLLLFTIILFAPLPYGSVEDWSRSLLQILCFLLFMALLSNSDERYVKYLPSNKFLTIPFILFFFILLLQVIPLPGYILSIIAPENFRIWNLSKSFLDSPELAQIKEYYTISLYPYTTVSGIVNLASYIVFGYCVSVYCSDKKGLRAVLLAVLAISLIQAIIGIAQFFIFEDKLFAHGTYVNRNHFAGFIELTVFVMFAYVLAKLKPNNKSHQRTATGIISFMTDETLMKRLALSFIPALLVISLILSFSRMGIISFIAGFIFMYAVYDRWHQNLGTQYKPVFLFFLITFVTGFLIVFYPLAARFFEVMNEVSGRFIVWRDSLQIVKDFPVFGTGLGTFENIYPKYKTLEKAVGFNYAHNDYIQLAVETGVAGFSCLMIALVVFLRHSVIRITNYYRGKSYFVSIVKLGALSSIIAILVHSLADFNLHIPANALYFSMMIGIVLSDNSREI